MPIKNKVMTDFTGFVFTKFKRRDWLILLILTISLLLTELIFFKVINIKENDINIIVSVMLCLLPWYFLDLRFRNLLFSIVWAALIIQYFFVVHYNNITAMPLIGFMSFQLMRIIFWHTYKREFLPTLFGLSHYRARFSNIQNQKTTGEDAVFSVILFFGIIILIDILI